MSTRILTDRSCSLRYIISNYVLQKVQLIISFQEPIAFLLNQHNLGKQDTTVLAYSLL